MTVTYDWKRGVFGARAALLGLVLSGAVAAAGCAPQPKMPVQPQNAAGEVRDVNVIPQNLALFAGQAGGNALLRSQAAADEDMQAFRRRFFAPWDSGKLSRATLREFEAVLNWAPGKRGYAENLRPWSDAAWEQRRAGRGIRPGASGHCREDCGSSPGSHREAPLRPCGGRRAGLALR